MSTKISTFCLFFTAITVQCAVINKEVLQRLPRSPCYSCGMSSPQLPPPPSPYFRTQHWSGYGRSIDGAQQGVFSGAAATVGGSQAAGEAFSLASADKSNGNYAAPQQDNNRQDQDANKFKVTQYHYGSESHGANYGLEGDSKTVKEDNSAQVPISTGSFAQSSSYSDASNVKAKDNEQQQVQLNNWPQSHGYGSPHIQKDNKPDLPPQDPSVTPKHDATYFESNSDKTAQNSGQYHHDSSQVNRGDLGQGETQTSGSYSSQGSAGAASATQLQEGQLSHQTPSLKAAPKPQVPQLVGNYGTKSGAYSGSGYQSGGSNSQSSSGYSSGAGYGHSGYQGYQQQQQQQQQQQVSGGSGYSHGANGANANGHGYSGYQDTLKDALSLASQGLETSRQAGGAAGAGGAGCPSCAQSGSYALSNARSHSGNAVALSIGG